MNPESSRGERNISETGLSVARLHAWRQEDVPHVLLDVREAPELEICQVEGALHLPMSEIAARLDEVPREGKLVVMCHHGMRSLRVARFLREAGFHDVVNLEGGIDAWASQIDNGMARY